MNKIFNVRDITNLIKQMETDLGLLTNEAYGKDARYIWEDSRWDFFNYLNCELLSFEISHTPKKKIFQLSIIDFIYLCGRYLNSIIFKNWIWAKKYSEWMVVQFKRKKKTEKIGLYEDIFTNDLINYIGIHKCIIMERQDTNRRHYKQDFTRTYHLYFMALLSRIVLLFMPLFYKYDKKDINRMKYNISNYIKDKTQNYNIKFDGIFKEKTFFSNLICYEIMLKWLKPKKILFADINTSSYMVLPALKLKIPVVELQHGMITPENILYTIPENMTKTIFPDYFLFFGKHWHKTIDNFPLPSERSIVLGYPYFNRMKNEYKNIKKIKKQILIISQGVIGNKLHKFAIKLAEIRKDYNILYKLHPGEYSRARGIYPELYKAQTHGLLEVIDSDKPLLYYLFAQSYWQIGVSSTALFEGIALGCQTILIDLPSVECMEFLINGNYAQLVKKPEEIDFNKYINLDDLKEDLFADNWRSNWKKFEDMNLTSRNKSYNI